MISIIFPLPENKLIHHTFARPLKLLTAALLQELPDLVRPTLQLLNRPKAEYIALFAQFLDELGLMIAHQFLIGHPDDELPVDQILQESPGTSMGYYQVGLVEVLVYVRCQTEIAPVGWRVMASADLVGQLCIPVAG